MRSLNVIGLNSGTSMDGVDAALFRIKPLDTVVSPGQRPRLQTELLASVLYPFDDAFRSRLKKLTAAGTTSLEEMCRLNVALGEIFAEAARSLMRGSGRTQTDVDLVGSHGQTLWHAPASRLQWGVPTTGTMQLGEPAVIAARLGIPVVADFRVADMAAGGQGAPLVSFADEILFGQDGVPTGILNIGGIANITVIDAAGEAVLAFDTGPGNMVMDRAAEVLFHCDFDPEGSLALRGQIDEDWLSDLLNKPYFRMSPPKTTGRELFGNDYADDLIAQAATRGLSAHDAMATLTALTTSSIVESYVQHIEPVTTIDRLVLGGGGADNKTLVKFLEDFWPHRIQILRHEDFGISTKFKEALLFALLAYTTYFGIPNNVPRCTGATRRVCLGKLCRP